MGEGRGWVEGPGQRGQAVQDKGLESSSVLGVVEGPCVLRAATPSQQKSTRLFRDPLEIRRIIFNSHSLKMTLEPIMTRERYVNFVFKGGGEVLKSKHLLQLVF